MSEVGVPAWLGDPRARGIGGFIDHTLLRPEATREQVLRLCDEGAALGVKAVCVNGAWVAACVERLRGSGVLVAATVGFPLGAMASAAKADEAKRARTAGADELDMVVGVGQLKAGELGYVGDDVRAVVEAAGGAAVKAILETAALAEEEIEAGCRAAVEAGAAFVKTSTGFHPAGGATVEAVSRMRRTVGPGVGVKASGGIRTAAAAIELLVAGANRIGTSATTSMEGVLGAEAPPLEALLRGQRLRCS